MENRTDLALESYENQQKTVLPGVKVREQDGISVVEVLDARGEKALGKPVGKYITYRVSPMAQETQLFDGRLERIADLLRGLLPDHPTGVLVAGVGNTAITADALGPETNRYVLATRHIAGELRRALGPLTDVSTVTTGVVGNTGMESAEVVAGMVHTVHPDCVLVVDALAASSADRLGTTVQLSNAGIAPGSGVGNHRMGLDRASLGVPVVAVVGDVAPGAEDAYQEGVTAIVSTNRRAVPWEVARQSARADLCAALEDLFRLYNAFRAAR